MYERRHGDAGRHEVEAVTLMNEGDMLITETKAMAKRRYKCLRHHLILSNY
jgi:hypothetical protein